MKKDNKKSRNVLVMVLYAIAILLGVYTIFTVYNSYIYISGLVSQGLVISDELQNVINYFVGASAPYLFYSIVIWAIGYIINKVDYISNEVKKHNDEDINDKCIITEVNEEVQE